jgi:uncharacterized spore protein YtfJ
MEVKDLLREVAEKIERTANVKAVFGDPIGEGNEMIVPVARVGVRAGGGGGSGDTAGGPGPRGRGNGIGLGMKIDAAPVGYIKRTQDGAVFISTIDRNRAIALGAGVAIVSLLVVRAGIRLFGNR